MTHRTGRYTPTSGIWQTVWIEHGLPDVRIASVDVDQASRTAVKVTAHVSGSKAGAAPSTTTVPGVTATTTPTNITISSSSSSSSGSNVMYVVVDPTSGETVARAVGKAGAQVTIDIPAPVLWSPDNPHLYDLTISLIGSASGQQAQARPLASMLPPATPGAADAVLSYFGLRTFALDDANVGAGGKRMQRPLLNGNYTYLIGMLDQSWWPDGLYTAPTDAALASDLQAVASFGMNTLRLHQKVNPQRWYYHADRLGVVVLQDAVQWFGHAAKPGVIQYFMDDMAAMIRSTRNHPAVVQYQPFNEVDCYAFFNLTFVLETVKSLDPTRLVDIDSGGYTTSEFNIGDVLDRHTYPQPGTSLVFPTATQYALLGEFGGIGAIIKGKEWRIGGCHSYGEMATPADQARTYITMAKQLLSAVANISGAILTQVTDLESECDGFLNYDRSHKLNTEQLAAVKSANEAIIAAAAASNVDINRLAEA